VKGTIEMKSSFAVAGLLLVALPLLVGAPLAAQEVPVHDASDPGAPEVTLANVLENDRFWPYRVALLEPTTPPGASRPIRAGLSGVLVEVNSAKRVRIDFGRDGILEVPIEETNLVAESNRVRLGELDKLAPNLIAALGPRLVESGAPGLRQLDFAQIGPRDQVILVFADPTTPQFAPLAKSLAPYQARNELLTILVPQGNHSDAEVRRSLRERGWTVPFVYRHLAPGYTKSLVDEGIELPAVRLSSAEGRTLFDRAWGEEAGARLGELLESTYGPQAPHTPSETGASSGGVTTRVEERYALAMSARRSLE